jgi:uncharacterized SAM-binding protein YcdF (DUF218 family)
LPLPARFLVIGDSPKQAAAIAPLAGEKARVVYGAELFNQGYAKWFVITNMALDLPGINEPYNELVRKEAIRQGVSQDQILVSTEIVETTMGEARVLRQLAEEQGWSSLLVVTSPYHTRRARHILLDAFAGSGIRISVGPVPGHWYEPQSWWREPTGLRVTWDEYVKYGLYLAGYRG